jgi:hypothetical protein
VADCRDADVSASDVIEGQQLVLRYSIKIATVRMIKIDERTTASL